MMIIHSLSLNVGLLDRYTYQVQAQCSSLTKAYTVGYVRWLFTV